MSSTYPSRRAHDSNAEPSHFANHRIEVWVALFGLLYYIAHGGWASLNPCDVAWLRKTNDWTQQYLGWAFGRQAPWSFPFGAIPDLGRPVGTSIAFTGANPLLSLILRPFASLLPTPFQFNGPWMGACLALQGVFGVKLTRAVLPKSWEDDRLMPGLGGCLFVVAPILLHRIDHDTLMAHFLILGSLWLCLLSDAPSSPPWRIQRRYLVLFSVVAAGVHPYLLSMVAPFLMLALGNGVFRAHSPRPQAAWRAGVAVALWLLLVGCELYVLGYFSKQDDAKSWGFGHFNADLSILFNPIGWSRLLPSLPYTTGQFYEGFGFMGLGGLALMICAATFAAMRPQLCRPSARHMAVVAITVGMALFAFSSNITWLGRGIIDLRSLYVFLGPVPAILRSSGRLFWPMHYLLLTFAIYIITHTLRRQSATLVVAAALGATLVDLQPEKVGDRLLMAPYQALRAPIWEQVAPGTRHVIMLPPLYPASGGGECAPWRSPTKYEVPPSFYAAEHGMSINSVYASRPREALSHAYCVRIVEEALRGEFQRDAVYLVDPRLAKGVINDHPQLTCWQADDRIGCVHREHQQHALVVGLLRKAQASGKTPSTTQGSRSEEEG